MTFPTPPIASRSSQPLALGELNDLKHAVIGNPVRKLEVLADDTLVQSLIAACRAESGESRDGHARRLEAIIVVGSLCHVGLQAMQSLLIHSDLLSNLHSSLRAALPASTPSLAQPTTTPHDPKALTAALQSLANAVGEMQRFVVDGRFGSGLAEGDRSSECSNVTEETRAEWRGAVARHIHDFLEDGAATDLLTLLPVQPDLPSSSIDTQSSSFNLPTRALVPLLQLLHDLASLAPSTKAALLSAPRPARSLKGKERAAYDAGGAMDVDEAGTGSHDTWAFDRVRGVLKMSLAATKSVWGDQARVLRAALKLTAVLALDDYSVSVAISSPLLAGLSHPDEGVRFGAAYAFSHMVAFKRNTPPPAEAFAKFLTALLGLWADITASRSTPPPTAAAALIKASEATESQPVRVLTEDQIRAVFLLASAIQGQVQAHALLVEMGVLRRLGELLTVGSGDDIEWQETRGARMGSVPRSEAEASDELELGEEDREGHARLREGLLLTFAAVVLSSTQYHAAVLQVPTLIRSTLASLGHPTASVRAAACQLIRGLSRNVGVLRETLVDSGVGWRLVAVLKGSNATNGCEREEVLAGALASVANLLLEFSPMKETLLEAEILPCIVGYARKPWGVDVRLNALWALKNFAYRASQRHRHRLLASLQTLRLPDVDWTRDTESEEVKEAANLLSNVLIGADPAVRQAATGVMQSPTLDVFLLSATSALPATEASRTAFKEVCTLLRTLHAAQPSQAGQADGQVHTQRLLESAVRALEHDVPGTQLPLARLIATLIQDLRKADTTHSARLGNNLDTVTRLETICARPRLDNGGADPSFTDLAEALAWIAAHVASAQANA